MKQQVLQFQTDKGIGKDGIPGSETIKAILDNRGGGTSTPAQPQTAEQNPAAPATTPAAPDTTPAAPATTPTAPAQNPEKLKPEPQLPPLNKLTTKDVGTWQGDKFVIKAGLEQQDSKGIYINVAGQKYYKDATDGLGYKIDKNPD